MANLFFRRSSQSPTCLICNLADESTEHLFLQCPWVEVLWYGGSMTWGVGRDGITSWANWLSGIYADGWKDQIAIKYCCHFLAYMEATMQFYFQATTNLPGAGYRRYSSFGGYVQGCQLSSEYKASGQRPLSCLISFYFSLQLIFFNWDPYKDFNWEVKIHV